MMGKKYGDRAMKTIRSKSDISVVSANLPNLPDFVEDLSFLERMDDRIFDVDLILNFLMRPDITPAVLRIAGEHGVDAMIIAGGASKAGSVSELDVISKECGVFIGISELLCSFSGSRNETMNEFVSRFGRPSFDITTDGGMISSVEVVRGSICGGSWWVAKELIGVKTEEAPIKAGFLIQVYPCRASRGIKGKIHVAAEIHKKAVEDALIYT